MKEEKKKGRRAYLEHFQKNSSGEYVYQGTQYRFLERGKKRKDVLIRLWVLYAAMIGAVLINGCLPMPGMGNCIYLILPYAVQVIAAISTGWTLGRMSMGGSVLWEHVYQATVEALPHRALITVAGAGAGAAGEMVYLIRHSEKEGLGYGFLFLVLEAVIAATAMIFRKNVKAQEWIKQ